MNSAIFITSLYNIQRNVFHFDCKYLPWAVAFNSKRQRGNALGLQNGRGKCPAGKSPWKRSGMEMSYTQLHIASQW